MHSSYLCIALSKEPLEKNWFPACFILSTRSIDFKNACINSLSSVEDIGSGVQITNVKIYGLISWEFGDHNKPKTAIDERPFAEMKFTAN